MIWIDDRLAAHSDRRTSDDFSKERKNRKKRTQPIAETLRSIIRDERNVPWHADDSEWLEGYFNFQRFDSRSKSRANIIINEPSRNVLNKPVVSLRFDGGTVPARRGGCISSERSEGTPRNRKNNRKYFGGETNTFTELPRSLGLLRKRDSVPRMSARDAYPSEDRRREAESVSTQTGIRVAEECTQLCRTLESRGRDILVACPQPNRFQSIAVIARIIATPSLACSTTRLVVDGSFANQLN